MDSQSSSSDSLSEQISKIKGDAIGDTLYSERWVLRTLIKLSELTADNWTTELEQDLCFLWDMTAEKDVVLFLFRNDFFGLFCKVTRVTNVARCIEMMVGIMANISCVDEVRGQIATHEAGVILVNLITSEDSLTLVQLLRLLNTCLWSERVDSNPSAMSTPSREDSTDEIGDKKNLINGDDLESTSPWLKLIVPYKELLLQHLRFFFASAVNEELLCSSLDLMDTLLKIPLLYLPSLIISSAELSASLAECLRQLLRGAKVGDSLTANKRLWRACEVWLSVIGVIASNHEGRIHLGAQGDILTKCFTKLLLLLMTPDALKTQDPEMAVLCLCVLETLPVCPVSPPVLARLITELSNLDTVSENLCQTTEDTFQVTDLIYRSSQFLKRRLEETEDFVAIVQNLSNVQINYLRRLFSEDTVISDKISRSILQIRTNGLIQ